MLLTASLANELYKAFFIERWNDRLRPMPMAEIDKHAHKLITAYCLGRYEEQQGRLIDWLIVFKDTIFELLRRVALSDIKSPIYQSIKADKQVFFKLNQFVEAKIDKVITDDGLKAEFHNFLFNESVGDRQRLEYRIVDAAHVYASFWEFNIVKAFNPFPYQNAKVEQEIRHKLDSYADLLGIDNLLTNHSVTNFVDLCGQLRFQIRWARTPRANRTSVLGHLMLTAALTYFISLELNAAPKRLYNNVFGALFHDIPEIVTRDIISPVKRSSTELDNLIAKLEQKLAEKEIFPYLEKDWITEVRYWTQNEFENKITDKSGNVRLGMSTEDFDTDFGCDCYNPFDGKVVRFADQYSAYLEASQAIASGTPAPDFIAAKEQILRRHGKAEFGNIRLTHLFNEQLIL